MLHENGWRVNYAVTRVSATGFEPGTAVTNPVRCHSATAPDVSYGEHKTNEYARQGANIIAGPQELLVLLTVRHRKLSSFGHSCRHYMLPKIILQGTVDGRPSRRRGRPRKSCKDNIKNGQASRCRHCCASHLTEIGGQSCQQISVGVPQIDLPGCHGY